MKTLLLCLLPLLAAAQVPSNGTYNIYNSAQALVWDDPGFSKANGTHVVLWPVNGGINQNWLLTSIGSGYYTIKNQASGLLLDDPGSSTASGTQLIQWPSNGGRNQHWLVTASGSGYTMRNQASGLLVDPGGNTQNANIAQRTASGATTQIWHARKKTTYSISGNVSGSAANLTLSGTSSGATSADSLGNYAFSNLTNGNYVVAPSESGFTFAPTTASESVSGANISGVNFTGTANTTHSVQLDTTDTDPNISGYIYWRSTTSGCCYAQLNTVPAGLQYIDRTVVSGGGPYYYVVDAVDINSMVSSHSPEAVTGVIP